MAIALRDLFVQNEFWAFLFVLGWAALNWPMITMAKRSLLWGLPSVLVYVAAVWLVIILVLYLFDRRYSG